MWCYDVVWHSCCMQWLLMHKYIVQGFAWGIHGIMYICHNYMTASDTKTLKTGTNYVPERKMEQNHRS